MNALEQIRTAIFLVPYVVRNRGVPVEDLARRLGLTLAQLHQQLDLLMMVGRPPFTPDTLVEIYEEGGRVFVELAQSLKFPPRLNAFEAMALAAAALPFAEERGGGPAAVAVRQALDKIMRALPVNLREWVEKVSRQVLIVMEQEPHLAILRRAAEERLEVDMVYVTAGRGEMSERTVCPYGLVQHAGSWYLAAWCRWREEVRVFRVSRILEARLSDRIFDPPPAGFDAQAFVQSRVQVPAHGEQKIVIRFSPGAARWVAERAAGHGLRRQADGSVELELFDLSREFVCSLVASFAGEAELVEPSEWRDGLRGEAAAALSLYGEAPQP